MGTRREAVLTAYRLGMPGTVPVVIFGGGVWTMHNSGNRFEQMFGQPEKYADLLVEYGEVLRSDIVYVGSGFNNCHCLALGVPARLKFRPAGAPDLEEPLVKTRSDLDAMTLDGFLDHEVIATIHKASELVHSRIGGERMIAVTAWGPFTLSAQVMGFERLMQSLFKDKELARGVLDFTAEMLFKLYEPLVRKGHIDTVSLADSAWSASLISRKQCMEFALPPVKRLIARLKELGTTVFLHICGDTNDRLEFFPETGADLISVDKMVDMARLKEKVGHLMCVGGNVPPVEVLDMGSPDDVRRASAECIRKAGRGGGYVLMPACDLPHTVPLENIRAMVDTALSWDVRELAS